MTNKDGSTEEMYLVSNHLELSTEKFKTLYKKRWSVEEYHQSLKQNVSLAKTATTQSNHLFASLVAYLKWEKLKWMHKLNHFALKAKIYWAAAKAAWRELGRMKREEGV
ncbi:MAG: transposase [Planctomycetaceae bacterium]|nr:transposase [Planctomycetaceae bacterium]